MAPKKGKAAAKQQKGKQQPTQTVFNLTFTPA
jgi:hypothetical protein